MNASEIYTHLLDLEQQLEVARNRLKKIAELTHKYGHPGVNLATHRALADIREIAEEGK